MNRFLLLTLALTTLAACGDDPARPDDGDGDGDGDGNGSDSTYVIPTLGHGAITDRYTAEVAVDGATAYTTTTSFRQQPGNTVYIWDVSGDDPQLVDTLLVSAATTLGDVQISPDGGLLVVPTESNGSLLIYDRSDPRAPTLITRYFAPEIQNGVHTVKLGVVDGTLYAFLQIDPRAGGPAQLVILDLTDPASPVHVFDQVMGSPFVHDVFVRDGLLFTAQWDDGLVIYDIGGGDLGGTPAAPARIGDIVLGEIHNIWWFHDPTDPANRYVFLGQEIPLPFGTSSGDVHVVDISDMTDPVYVARYRVAGAGAHNFVMDEASGILYAAYYNGGVRALDVRGDLSDCAEDEMSAGVCDLALMGREVGVALPEGHFVWGVALEGSDLYASDMLSGIYKLDVSELIRD